MKKVSIIARSFIYSLFVSAILLFGCESKKPSDNELGDDGQKKQVEIQSKSKLLSNYFTLKDALVKTDAKAAMMAAKELAANSEAVIKSNAELIAQSEDVEAQRKAFEKVTMGVYEHVKSKGADIDVYKQYCPMAFNNVGAFWLSSKEEIRNPYFGDVMLKCGKVEEVLAKR